MVLSASDDAENLSALAQPRQAVDLLGGERSVVGCRLQVRLHLADDLHGLPQPLARVGVARRRLTPGLDVFGLERRKSFAQYFVVERRPRLLGARQILDKLDVVGHGSHPTSPPMRTGSIPVPCGR